MGTAYAQTLPGRVRGVLEASRWCEYFYCVSVTSPYKEGYTGYGGQNDCVSSKFAYHAYSWSGLMGAYLGLGGGIQQNPTGVP